MLNNIKEMAQKSQKSIDGKQKKEVLIYFHDDGQTSLSRLLQFLSRQGERPFSSYAA